jgi:thiol-disulfide isomerase/thioredoxin
MADVAKERGIEYHVAKDSTQAAAKAWRVMWWPTYGVVDRSGNLRALGLKPTYVDKVIDKLLEEEKGGATTAPTAAAPDANTGPAAAKEDSAVKQEWLEGTAEERARFKGMEGKAPPALAVSNWVNGKEQKLADLKGKVVMLDFWATWCGPCIASIPHTNELQAKYKDKGLVVIGICHSQGADKMADTVKEKSIEYTVAADKGGKTVATYKVNGFPDYYFIDRAGNLRICDCSNGSVEKAIEALLAEPENASASAK